MKLKILLSLLLLMVIFLFGILWGLLYFDIIELKKFSFNGKTEVAKQEIEKELSYKQMKILERDFKEHVHKLDRYLRIKKIVTIALIFSLLLNLLLFFSTMNYFQKSRDLKKTKSEMEFLQNKVKHILTLVEKQKQNMNKSENLKKGQAVNFEKKRTVKKMDIPPKNDIKRDLAFSEKTINEYLTVPSDNQANSTDEKIIKNILDLHERGYSNQEIAELLGMGTIEVALAVKFHKKNNLK